nr:hypothetical protein [Thermophilibacter provencensis]
MYLIVASSCSSEPIATLVKREEKTCPTCPHRSLKWRAYVVDTRCANPLSSPLASSTSRCTWLLMRHHAITLSENLSSARRSI